MSKAKKGKTVEDLNAGFPKVTYRVSSPAGSHRTLDDEAGARTLAADLLETEWVCRPWVAIDKITSERILAVVR